MEARTNAGNGYGVTARQSVLRTRIPPQLAVALFALLVTAAVFGIHAYRYRFVKMNSDMFRFLPETGVTRFYVDVWELRRTGTLNLLTGSRVTTEPDYQEFVKQTQFDYPKDLDGIAGTSNGDQLCILARGHFSWERLTRYVSARGGICDAGICSVPSSSPGRFVSFLSIQPDLLAVALSGDRWAARRLEPPGHQVREPLPVFPIWVRVPEEVLEHLERLPLTLRIFAITLQPADRVVLSLGPAREKGAAAFDLRLDATCRNKATAETMRRQLEIQTKMLSLELAREHVKPNPADLTGLLTSGRFEAADRQIVGIWPIRQELLKALQ